MGTMRLYNTMSRQVEDFTPRGPDIPVTIYACGITPYDVSHLGHVLVSVTYDVVARYLRYKRYLETNDRLNISRPDVYAKATEETDKMIEIISGLLEDGLAYEKRGNIYF